MTDADLEKITSTSHAWREGRDGPLGRPGSKAAAGPAVPPYQDVAGFCKSATPAEIAAQGHVLRPGRYVGAEEVEDDGDLCEEKMPRLVADRARAASRVR